MTAQTILPANSVTGSYEVENSLRFNGGSTDFFTTTQTAVTAERKKFTISCWAKRSLLTSGNQTIASAGNGGGSEEFSIFFKSNDTLEVYHHNGSAYEMRLITNMLFRDPSAWYNIVFVCDTANGTAALRQRLFVNGVELTDANSDFSTYDESPQNDNLPVNVDERFQIGSASWGNPGSGLGNGLNLFSGYIAEFYQTAGQANIATKFGEFDEDSGIWKPIDVSGLTFGNNGFYLDFKASSNLGNDANGGTDLGETNLAATDQSTDTCTNNFATLNPLIYESRDNTFAEGNLKITGGGSDDWVNKYGVSNFAVSSGKWFVEAKMTTVVGSQGMLGIMGTSTALVGSMKDNGPANIDAGGRITGGGNNIQTGLTNFANGNIAGAAFDATNGTIQFYRNGSAYGNAVSSIASDTYYFVTNSYDAGAVVEFNFGSPPYSESGGNSDGDGHGNFSMAVPSGYFALNTKNLAEYG